MSVKGILPIHFFYLNWCPGVGMRKMAKTGAVIFLEYGLL